MINNIRTELQRHYNLFKGVRSGKNNVVAMMKNGSEIIFELLHDRVMLTQSHYSGIVFITNIKIKNDRIYGYHGEIEVFVRGL